MALASKKTERLVDFGKDGQKAKLQEKFDDPIHLDTVLDNPDDFPELASILLQLQNLNDDMDEVRTFASANKSTIVSNAAAITDNTSKDTFPGFGTSDRTCLAGNTTTITTDQASEILLNTKKIGITEAEQAAIKGNSDKTGITSAQTSAITANTAKTGISTSQATAITANTAKVSMAIGTRETEAMAGNTTTISTDQVRAIEANTAKVGTAKDLAPGTEGGTLTAAVTEERGAYTLTFTFVTSDGRTTKTASIAMR